MKSDAATVDDFLKEQSETIRKDLQQLRRLVRSEAPEAREGMRYGGPVYSLKDGPILCGFTAQKNNLAGVCYDKSSRKESRAERPSLDR